MWYLICFAGGFAAGIAVMAMMVMAKIADYELQIGQLRGRDGNCSSSQNAAETEHSHLIAF